MRQVIVMIMSLFSVLGAQEKFGDRPIVIDKDATKKWTSTKIYTTDDSLQLTVFGDLKLMPMPIRQGDKLLQSSEVLVFEKGNPFSNSVAIITQNLTARHLQLLVSLKEVLQDGQDAGEGSGAVELTQDEAENLILTVSKWLSDKRLKK